MDFYNIKVKYKKKDSYPEIYPDFRVCKSKDLMVRGKSFYAVWNAEQGLWSTNEYDIQQLVDKELYAYKEEMEAKTNEKFVVLSMQDFSSGIWVAFKRYMQHLSDSSVQLDTKLTFASTKVKKSDHVSKRLSYDLKEGDISGYKELVSTLYGKDERAKLEWAIGSIVAGDARDIQKFIVLFGDPGAGKGTILTIIQKLFEGYFATFDAKALTASNNQFATEAFKSNPLVAIQHDGDLSKVEDNTKLNSIVSHEEMSMRELYKPSYTARANCFLFMATNTPVKITNAKSGIIRRLIDVKPSGKRVTPRKYQELMTKVDFELGAIAHHCLEVYRGMGKNYYSGYKPLDMIYKTDTFFNFVEDYYLIFKADNGVSLKQAYAMYKEYCEEASASYTLAKHIFREELKNYFGEFHDVKRIDGKQVRNYYDIFLANKFKNAEPTIEHQYSLVMDHDESLLDSEWAECKAQLTTKDGTPSKSWRSVTTTLSDIDSKELHYVKPPKNHIVIDFDLTDDNGNKNMAKNLEAASKWPSTYSEFSKSGEGIHLHYYYDGDVSKLSAIFDEHIEVLTFSGLSSLRRKLTLCNTVAIATISSGLPLKGDTVINFESVKSEQMLRSLIKKALRKEVHQGTKPNVDFISKVINDAYETGLTYDVSDMRPTIMGFASNSTNQASVAIKVVRDIPFKSEEVSPSGQYATDELVFFDVEIFPNLFLVVWKVKDGPCIRMINPSPSEIEELLSYKLIGFNCRRYDNHMLYARYIGYNEAQCYELSQRIIHNSKNATFAEAYSLSYTDVYEFSSTKQSLKKFEIELGIHHKELGLPWDEPVPEELWTTVAEYCDNDVIATEAVFNDRKADWLARLIIAKMSGLTENDTTQNHAAKIIFGDDKHAKDQFIHTDLSKEFPGYTYEFGKSTYRGINVGEGGYVDATPGMYWNTGLLDVESLHPWSLIILNYFGKYTYRFEELVQARVAVKHGDMESAAKFLDGLLVEFMNDPDITLKDLSYALKIVINIIYGMTSAKFDNPFKDPNNIDNIVAKRGALFMIDLMFAVREEGYKVAHIKTDSIKIPNIDDYIINFVIEFGKKYGYTFIKEAVYEKMCLVNDAVYLAKYLEKDGEECHDWTATGAQFKHPYVFKTMVGTEDLVFSDLCETKAVTTKMYLDINEELLDDKFPYLESQAKKLQSKYNKLDKQLSTMSVPESEDKEIEILEVSKQLEIIHEALDKYHNYQFVGKVGSFCPIEPGYGGGLLMREKDGNYHAATGTSGFRWLEAEYVQGTELEKHIDKQYFINLYDKAKDAISQYGDFNMFISDEPQLPPSTNPTFNECPIYAERNDCVMCPHYINTDNPIDLLCAKGYETIPF